MTAAERLPVAELLDSVDPTNPGHLPPHLIRRLELLRAEEPVIYADRTFEPTDPDVCTGRFVLVTASRFIEATAKEAPTFFGGLDDARNEERTTEKVTAETWSRSRLAEIELTGRDADWTRGRTSDSASIPPRTGARLTFDGRRTLSLPLDDYPAGNQPQALSMLIRALLVELGDATGRRGA